MWAAKEARRTWTTKRERLIVKYGLSPWSYGTKCDYCERDGTETLAQYGRWMLHAACAERAERDGLRVIHRPPIVYAPLQHLSVPMQLALMKCAMLETGTPVMEAE